MPKAARALEMPCAVPATVGGGEVGALLGEAAGLLAVMSGAGALVWTADTSKG